MELTFATLVSVLPDYAPAAAAATAIAPQPWRTVSVCDALDPADPPAREDCAYVGPASALPGALPGANFIVWDDAGLDARRLAFGHANVLVVPTEAALAEVKAGLLSVLADHSRLNRYADELLGLVQDGAKPQRLLDLVSVVLGNPVLLLDTSLGLLASSGTAQAPDDSTIAYVLQNGFMPEAYIEEVIQEESAGEAANDKVLIIWEKDFLDHRVIAGRIVLADRLLGYLKVFETTKPFTPYFDAELLKLACRYLAVSLNPSLGPSAGDPRVESFLRGLIERRFTDPPQIARRAEQLGLELRPSLVVIGVQFEESFRNPDKLFILKKKLQSFLNRATVLIVSDLVVALYDRDSERELFDAQRMAYMRRFLEENNCRAAYSLPFSDLPDFPRYFLQAAACFTVAEQCQSRERVLLYEDYKVWHMLAQFASTVALSNLVHPGVRRLVELDAERGSDLAHTLFEFLHHHQDMTLTAKSVQLHYNSLKYRVNRIQELTGIDFDNPDEVFKIL
ncbi:MAG: helix-turn-helix domain-containing protein, partial [Propionibacteriaceae bacterium]|nr:helix-turn-helix domain-containing protein [Propionibacteriaceae bacterium]